MSKEEDQIFLIETSTLRVVKANLNHASFIFRLLNTPKWLQYIGNRNINSTSAALSYIKKSLLARYAKNGFGLYVIELKEGNVPIGLCGFLKRDYLDYPDIGFALLPEYEGSGFMYQAAKAIMSYGKSHLNFTTILAITSHNNERSKKLLTKLGMSLHSEILPPKEKEPLLLFSNTKPFG